MTLGSAHDQRCDDYFPLPRLGEAEAGGFDDSNAVTAAERVTMPFLRKGFMIRLDRFRIVEVIDHQAVGFLQAAFAGISHPVYPLEPRAVAQMEFCYRVRPAGAVGYGG